MKRVSVLWGAVWLVTVCAVGCGGSNSDTPEPVNNDTVDAMDATDDTGAPDDVDDPDDADDAEPPDRFVLTEDLQRVASPVLDPRAVISPSTGENTVVFAADPCAVWDPQALGWRLYYSFFDAAAEAQGLPRTGLMGAFSTDGTSFEAYPALALEQQGTFDQGSVETCEVVVIEDESSSTGQRFLMFYSGSSVYDEDNLDADTEYVIALATSEDGVKFEPLEAGLSRDGVAGVLFGVSEAMSVEEEPGNFITDPTVAIKDGVFFMWTLCIRQIPEPFGGICLHTSTDATNWTHHGLVNGLDRAFAIQPTVYYNPEADHFEMYVVMDTEEEEARIHDVNTNLTLRVTGFFHATSDDGVAWTYDPVQAFSEDTDLLWENGGLATGADAAYLNGEVFFFYPSLTDEGGSILGNILNWPVNLALRKASDR